MKKTLIALAAVAVTSTAMAQVTISGEAGFGFDSDKTSAGVTAAGLEQTDGSVTIAVNEDLGGGMKLSASHTIDLKGRKGVTAENSSLSLTGGFGTLLMGSIEFGNGILGLGSAGAPLRGLDDGVALDGVANGDLFKYTTPALIPGLTANVLRGDSVGANAGAGRGDLQVTGFGINYSAGPLTVAADSTSYNYVAVAAATQADKRTRLSASYDLGVAKIGAGYQKKSYLLTGKPVKQTVVGVNVPMGAISFGAAMSTNKTDGGVKTKGTDAGVAYSLSKRTTVSFARMSSKVGTASSSSMTRLDLVHKF